MDNNFKIYLDLDGVLCDFIKQYELATGKPHSVRPLDWSAMDSFKGFWETMPWMPDGKKLWYYLKDKNVTILSAPSQSKTSRGGKPIWCKRELGSVPVIIEDDKWKYAAPDAILIDDRPKNIEPWVSHGGIGILHTSAEDTLKQLKSISFKEKIKAKFKLPV